MLSVCCLNLIGKAEMGVNTQLKPLRTSLPGISESLTAVTLFSLFISWAATENRDNETGQQTARAEKLRR